MSLGAGGLVSEIEDQEWFELRLSSWLARLKSRVETEQCDLTRTPLHQDIARRSIEESALAGQLDYCSTQPLSIDHPRSELI